MVVQAYILIQTDVGKAADVARAIAQVKGVTLAEDVTGPYDVIVRAEARNVDELGKLVVSKVQQPRRHHPHAHLSGGAHLSVIPDVSRAISRRLGPARVRGVCFGTTALLAALTLAACADEPVTLDPPQVSAEDLAACNAFIDDVPRRLDDEERRKVNPANSLGAAWGDPAIIVRCGVGVPAEFDQAAHCEVANDVGWFVPDDVIADQDADATFTAVGLPPDRVGRGAARVPPEGRGGRHRRARAGGPGPPRAGRGLRVSVSAARSSGSARAGSAGRPGPGSRRRWPPTCAGTSTAA